MERLEKSKEASIKTVRAGQTKVRYVYSVQLYDAVFLSKQKLINNRTGCITCKYVQHAMLTSADSTKSPSHQM